MDQQKSTNQGVRGIIVTRWNKNRAVKIASGSLPSQPTKLVRRWNKIDRKYIQGPQSYQSHCYNQGMGFVDRMDETLPNPYMD